MPEGLNHIVCRSGSYALLYIRHTAGNLYDIVLQFQLCGLLFLMINVFKRAMKCSIWPGASRLYMCGTDANVDVGQPLLRRLSLMVQHREEESEDGLTRKCGQTNAL